MKIKVHDDGRNAGNRCEALLIVTDAAEFCRVKFNPDTGFVRVFGGGVWPGELPAVFEKRGRATAQCPSNTFVREAVRSHFHGSVAHLSFEQ